MRHESPQGTLYGCLDAIFIGFFRLGSVIIDDIAYVVIRADSQAADLYHRKS